MKIRNGFVTNSSSSSFTMLLKNKVYSELKNINSEKLISQIEAIPNGLARCAIINSIKDLRNISGSTWAKFSVPGDIIKEIVKYYNDRYEGLNTLDKITYIHPHVRTYINAVENGDMIMATCAHDRNLNAYSIIEDICDEGEIYYLWGEKY
jgi:hypothetical protein